MLSLLLLLLQGVFYDVNYTYQSGDATQTRHIICPTRRILSYLSHSYSI